MDVSDTLDLVVVERDLSWQRTIEPGFEKRGPRVFEQELATDVVLTNACHSRVNHLRADQSRIKVAILNLTPIDGDKFENGAPGGRF